jgi:hypothetical protein
MSVLMLQTVKNAKRWAKHRAESVNVWWNRTSGVRRMARNGGFFNGERIVPYEGAEAGNRTIHDLLQSNRPIMIARYGLYELKAVASVRFSDLSMQRRVFPFLCQIAGFFPRDPQLLEQFARVYLEATPEVDCFAAWNYRHGLWKYEQGIFSEYCPQARLVDIRALDCFCFDQPWSAALEGRRVLVVHPFSRAIVSQYMKRERLFANPSVLPKFELQTLTAVQSIAGNRVPFDTWFDALDHMRDQISRREFDVAIIGAGAYGLPLAAHVKRMGKQAIHMGGVTQLLFGIRGKRWDDWYPQLFNEDWVRPDQIDQPGGFEKVEQGCYW